MRPSRKPTGTGGVTLTLLGDSGNNLKGMSWKAKERRRPSGVTLSQIPQGDPRNNLKGMSWKENERKRQSVIRKNIWAELRK